MDHAWRLPAVAGEEAFGPGAARLAEVPEESLGRGQALGRFEAKRVGIWKLQQERRYALVAAAAQAEFPGLFDRVDGVAAGVRERDDLRLRGLRLQQIGREVGGIERMAHGPHHLATGGRDERRGVALEGMPECVVGGDEKPGIATLLHQRL